MRKSIVYFLCIILMLILLALTIHFVSICFKPNKISKELYKNINKIYENDGMMVDISDLLKMEWDSIYILGYYCDSLEISRVLPSQYNIKGNNLNNSIILLKSGKVGYINYIHQDGFATPPVRFFIPHDGKSFLITHKENYKFFVWNNDNHYVLFPAKECAMENEDFFLNHISIGYDDRLFIEKLSAFLDGDLNLKELFK